MIQVIAIIAVAILAASADASEPKYYVKGKEVSKVDALKTLLANPKTEVTKCQLQEVSDKATLRNKRNKRK